MNCDIKNSEVVSTSRTRVDVKHDSQHGSFLSENATGDKHKKLKISWKSLTNFLVSCPSLRLRSQ